MKILICPDSFKGSLSSFEAASAVKEGLLQNNPDLETVTLPMADGGEGTAECLRSIIGGEYKETETVNIFFEKMYANQLLLSDGSAFIETAAASGILTVRKERLNPLKASTYGTGLLIKNAIDSGAENVIVGLGGSATNDGGMGVLSALGADFIDEDGNILKPTGENMIKVKNIFLRDEFEKYKNVRFTLACDVENVFYGQNGAAYIFASQKGANNSEIEMLDRGLENLEGVYEKHSHKNIQSVKGTGAAGGLCGGLYAFFDCTVESGFELLCRKAKLEKLIESCDLVITGEGRTDFQTRFGKLPFKVCRLANKYNKRCILISGDISPDAETEKMGFESAYKIKKESLTLEKAMKKAYNLLVETAKDVEVG